MIVGSIVGGPSPLPRTQTEPQQPYQTPQQQDTKSETSQPVTEGADSGQTDNSGADTGGAAEQESQQQSSAAALARTSNSTTRAEPRSVVNALAEAPEDAAAVNRARQSAEFSMEQARTKAMIDSVAVVQEQPDLFEPRERVDRYAPPDPLPTSDVLKRSAQKAPTLASEPPES